MILCERCNQFYDENIPTHVCPDRERELEAQLREAQGQVAGLRGVIQMVLGQRRWIDPPKDGDVFQHRSKIIAEALTNTTATAEAFVEHIRAEENEVCEQIAKSHDALTTAREIRARRRAGEGDSK